MNKFSENFKNLRIEKKLSQSEIAEALNTSQRRISFWETNTYEPSIEELIKVSEYFDISIDILVGKINY